MTSSHLNLKLILHWQADVAASKSLRKQRPKNHPTSPGGSTAEGAQSVLMCCQEVATSQTHSLSSQMKRLNLILKSVLPYRPWV